MIRPQRRAFIAGTTACAQNRECYDRFIFVNEGQLSFAPSFDALVRDDAVRSYLGRLAPALS
jgi:hypothetical protein